MLPILKILTPKVIRAIMEYVFEDNNLDQQMDAMQERVSKLEGLSHPKREFVVCNDCKCKVQEGLDRNKAIKEMDERIYAEIEDK